jgi:hypothetical protein
MVTTQGANRWQKANLLTIDDLNNSLNQIFSTEANKYFLSDVPHPLTFLAYKNLVEALINEDENSVNKATSFLSDSIRLKRPTHPTIFEWGANAFFPHEWDNIFQTLSTEAAFPPDLEQPSEGVIKYCQNSLHKSLDLLSSHSPQYHKLVEEMLRVIIIASPGHLSKQKNLSFGGATYFFLWGATILNPLVLSTFPKFLEQLVHEACHMALFSICNEHGILCTNPDNERFSSAFRSDMRPMHGIIHAYFVSKNIEACFSELASSLTAYSKEFKVFVETTSDASKSLFVEIKRHAELTPLGESILRVPEITHPEFLK